MDNVILLKIDTSFRSFPRSVSFNYQSLGLLIENFEFLSCASIYGNIILQPIFLLKIISCTADYISCLHFLISIET